MIKADNLPTALDQGYGLASRVACFNQAPDREPSPLLEITSLERPG